MNLGRVYLVGAGTGDAELFTRKGERILKDCDTVVYDDLIPQNLLEETKHDCEKIFVGKRFGKHSKTQEEIQEILIQQARKGKTVVRLKGGDPFVFGRGGEEALALSAAGIPYGIVPGISSAIAVPEMAGIPVTHRKTAQSFHVITGHQVADGREMATEDYSVLAKLQGTLIFLMGLHRLEEITEGLLNNGKNPETPAAVISHGTTPKQKTLRCSLVHLVEKVRQAALETPAIIVVGDVAAMDLSETVPYPLKGVKVGVTGTKTVTKKLREKLERFGAYVAEMDYSQILPYTVNEDLQKVLANLAEYQWIVFTSSNGVNIFFRFLQKSRIDIRTLSGLRFAVIGRGTADTLEQYGIFPTYMPQISHVESLAVGLTKIVKEKERILILRAEQGAPILTEILETAHILYTDCKIYGIQVDEEKREIALCCAEDMDFIAFTSGSGVRGFLEKGGRLPQKVRAVCIGTSTAKILQSYGYTDMLIAEKFDTDGIVETILKEVKYETF